MSMETKKSLAKQSIFSWSRWKNGVSIWISVLFLFILWRI